MSGNIQKYNILVLINVRWWNATAFYAVNIARLLKHNKHKVIIGCNRDYPVFKIAQSYGLKTVPLNFYGFNIFTLIRNFIRMIILIKKENIQFINSHRSEDHTFALLARWVAKVHFILTRGDRRRIKNNFFSRIRYYASDAVILTCQSIYKQNPFFNKIKDKVKVIYGSVDEDHFNVKKKKSVTAKKYKIDLRKKIIGIAGRLDTVKDQYTFINAASLIIQKRKDVFFVISGKEEHIKVKFLKKMITDLKLTNHILLLPKINDIADLINCFDIAVITSIDSETISRILLEYMYLKKPVIGTNVNVIGEMIIPKKNGELFNPGDHAQLANHLLILLDNPDLYKKYSKNSYDYYSKKYSEEIFYKQYLQIFNQVMK